MQQIVQPSHEQNIHLIGAGAYDRKVICVSGARGSRKRVFGWSGYSCLHVFARACVGVCVAEGQCVRCGSAVYDWLEVRCMIGWKGRRGGP